MLLRPEFDYLPSAIGSYIAKCTLWTPLNKRVAITIDDSDDPNLIGRRLRGIVRGADSARAMLLVHLSERIDYEGHYTSLGLEMIVATAAARWHCANRLLLTGSIVRLVDAPSFALQGFGRTIGTGRLVLDKS
jgi:hypothetical protein